MDIRYRQHDIPLSAPPAAPAATTATAALHERADDLLGAGADILDDSVDTTLSQDSDQLNRSIESQGGE